MLYPNFDSIGVRGIIYQDNKYCTTKYVINVKTKITATIKNTSEKTSHFNA